VVASPICAAFSALDPILSILDAMISTFFFGYLLCGLTALIIKTLEFFYFLLAQSLCTDDFVNHIR
jgi:hypothetical protein